MLLQKTGLIGMVFFSNTLVDLRAIYIVHSEISLIQLQKISVAFWKVGQVKRIVQVIQKKTLEIFLWIHH